MTCISSITSHTSDTRLIKKKKMRYTYQTEGTCSEAIEFEIVDDKLHNVQFIGGCDGNTQGVSRLVEGMKVEDVLDRLEGIRCGWKTTSCPDQLCKAIREVKIEN